MALRSGIKAARKKGINLESKLNCEGDLLEKIYAEQRRGNISTELFYGLSIVDFVLSTSRRYEMHNARVREYFRDRPDDLLELSFEEEQDPWSKITKFLGCDRPTRRKFPHVNAAPHKQDDVVFSYHIEANGYLNWRNFDFTLTREDNCRFRITPKENKTIMIGDLPYVCTICKGFKMWEYRNVPEPARVGRVARRRARGTRDKPGKAVQQRERKD